MVSSVPILRKHRMTLLALKTKMANKFKSLKTRSCPLSKLKTRTNKTNKLLAVRSSRTRTRNKPKKKILLTSQATLSQSRLIRMIRLRRAKKKLKKSRSPKKSKTLTAKRSWLTKSRNQLPLRKKGQASRNSCSLKATLSRMKMLLKLKKPRRKRSVLSQPKLAKKTFKPAKVLVP
jgi:hypothetical protein